MHMCVHACVCVDGGGEFCLEEGRIAKFQSYLIELRTYTGIVIGVAGTLPTITVFLAGGILIARKQCTDLG